MTNKERLEEIKEKYSEVTVLEYKNNVELVGVDINDLVWLIKQAEKVEQLQQENERLKAIIAEGNDCPECGITIRRTLFAGPSELEEKLQLSQKRISHIEKQLQQAEAKAERYEKALEFYADEKNHEYEVTYDMAGVIESPVMKDYGKIARQALEESK